MHVSGSLVQEVNFAMEESFLKPLATESGKARDFLLPWVMGGDAEGIHDWLMVALSSSVRNSFVSPLASRRKQFGLPSKCKCGKSTC